MPTNNGKHIAVLELEAHHLSTLIEMLEARFISISASSQDIIDGGNIEQIEAMWKDLLYLQDITATVTEQLQEQGLLK